MRYGNAPLCLSGRHATVASAAPTAHGPAMPRRPPPPPPGLPSRAAILDFIRAQPSAVGKREIAKAFGGPVKLVKGYPGRAEAKNSTAKARSIGWKPTLDVMDYIAAFLRAHPRSP